MTGDRAVSPEGWTLYAADPARGRSCGSCHECCVRIPVELLPGEGTKPANTRCHHLRGKGCGIYARRPEPCRYWSCRWLFDETTADIRRPDHAGYIIDSIPATILAEGQPVDCIQIWVDPKRPDAHRDPALRAWLTETCVKFAMWAIVRMGSAGHAITLVPAAMSASGEWLEIGGESLTEEEMKRKLAAVGSGQWIDRPL